MIDKGTLIGVRTGFDQIRYGRNLIWLVAMLWMLVLGAVGPLQGATLVVTNLNDSTLQPKTLMSASPCSGTLRQLLSVAAPGDTITFATGGTIFLTNGPLSIDKSIKIIGPATDKIRLDSKGSSSVITIASNATVTISNLTVSGGKGTTGGGILSYGNLTLYRCLISNNSATDGGGIYDVGGGVLVIDSCTISENTAGTDTGGGLDKARGFLFVTNSTFSQNYAYNAGAMFVSCTAIFESCTIASNSAMYIGGVQAASPVECRNTIIAGNYTLSGYWGLDVAGTIVSDGYVFIQNTSGCVITGDSTGNIYGQNPVFGPLQSNGGTTPTHALLPGSQALDGGNAGVVMTDQRGFPRLSGRNDIGAFQHQVARGHPVIYRLSGGILRMRFLGDENCTYLIQKTDSLENPEWTTVSTVTADWTCVVGCDDAMTKNSGFYRVVPQ